MNRRANAAGLTTGSEPRFRSHRFVSLLRVRDDRRFCWNLQSSSDSCEPLRRASGFLPHSDGSHSLEPGTRDSMKKTLLALAPLALSLALPLTALGGDDEDGARRRRPDGDRPSREEIRARILEKFDEDGDGKLNETERKAAMEARRERRGDRGPGQGRPDADRPGQGKRRPGEGRPANGRPRKAGPGQGKGGPGQAGRGKGRGGRPGMGRGDQPGGRPGMEPGGRPGRRGQEGGKGQGGQRRRGR